MGTSELHAVEINPPGAVRASVIWLHGLGADGHDFEPLIPDLGIVKELGVRVVLPHAPQRPVTINGGMIMRAWYDIRGPDFGTGEDEAGILASAGLLVQLIEGEEAQGIAAERILLAGFSQGGAMVLHTGLRFPRRLAGILALSSYLPLADTLAEQASVANRSIPIMMAHGAHDPVIPLALAERSRDRLQELGYLIDWRSYPMPHSVCPQQVQDLRVWLDSTLRTAMSGVAR